MYVEKQGKTYWLSLDNLETRKLTIIPLNLSIELIRVFGKPQTDINKESV